MDLHSGGLNTENSIAVTEVQIVKKCPNNVLYQAISNNALRCVIG